MVAHCLLDLHGEVGDVRGGSCLVLDCVGGVLERGHVGAVNQALDYFLPEVGLVGLVEPLGVMHRVHHDGSGVVDDCPGTEVGNL
jgi:hypothetical protein